MRNFLSHILGHDHKKIDPANSHIDRIEQGQNLLNDAAQGTIELAKEISEALRDKIDDCLVHIDTTNNILQDALIVTDTTGIIQTINPAAVKIFGYSDVSIEGSHITTLLSLDKDVNLRLNFSMEMFSKEANAMTLIESFMGKRKNGEQFYISASASMVTRKNKITYYIIVIRDETDNIEKNQELVESEQYFKAFSDASYEVMMIHNHKQILNFNDRLVELTEFSAQELSTFKPVYLFISENFESVISKEESEITENYESNLRSKSGKLVAVAVTSKPVLWEGSKARIKILHDISSNNNRKEYLEYSKDKFDAVVNNVADLICCFDENFIITFANHSFWEYFNLEQSDVIGKPILDFISEEDKQEIYENVISLTKENPILKGSYRMQVNDDVVWHNSINRSVFDDDGKFIEYQNIIKSKWLDQKTRK